MDEAEALPKIKARNFEWMEVSDIREKWKAEKVLCVAPKAARIPLHLLSVAVQDARTLEESREHGRKIQAILEWMWPTNIPQRFDVFQHGDATVQVPQRASDGINR